MFSMKNQLFIVFLTLVTVGLSEEEKRKTLIIAVDESKPEESTAIISDLNLDSLEGQPSAPVYRTSSRQYKPSVLQSSPIDKQLGYILLTPEDLKRLQNLDGVSVEEPKHVTLPHSLSQDSYDDNPSKERYSSPESPSQYHSGYPQSSPPESTAPYHSGYPPSPPSESHDYYGSSRDQKYPLRPAPPLSSLSSNSSLSDHDSYDPPKYTRGPQTSSQYDPYSSGEKDKGNLPSYDSGSSYERSKYGTSDYSPPDPSYGTSSYSSPGSPYEAPREPSYEKSHPAQISYSSKPEQYDHYSGKKQETYSPEPYMYSGYKPPQTGSYAKYSSGSKPPPEYTPSQYKYPITPDYNSNAKTYSSPVKYSSQDLPPHSYSEVKSSPYDSNKKIYSNQSPVIYENTYKGESVPNNNIPLNSYGSRNKYAPESLPPSSAYSSKPHYNEAASGEYPPKESYSTPLNKYNKGYSTKPYYSPQYEAPSKQRYYDGSKSSHTGVTGPSYQGVSHPPSDAYYYPPSSYSGRSPYKGASPVPYDSPATYEDKEVPYSGKSTSKIHGKVPSDGDSDLSPYKVYGDRKYPAKYKTVPSSSEGGDYSSSPGSSKSHSNYRGSSNPKNAVVTSFYENPPSYSEKDPTYESKYSEGPQGDKLSQHTEYGPSKYNVENVKSVEHTHYSSPTFESDHSKDKSYYDHSRGREAPLKLSDSHSATKNYKPSRPAPLYDEYDQPRYPPLPDDIKDSSEKSAHYDDYKDHSGEKSVHHGSNEKSYPGSYSSESYKPTSSEDKSHSYYPVSKDSSSGHYSDHSSHETDDPVVYTKTITKTYTKPQSDSSSETKYYGDQSSEDPYSSPNNKYSPPSPTYSSNSKYSPPTSYSSDSKYPPSSSYSSNSKYPPSSAHYSSNSKYSPSSSYGSNSKYPPSSSYSSPDSKSSTYTSDSDSYSGPHSYSETPGSSEYSYVKPADNGEKKFRYYTQNSNPETYLTETQRPKRVEGVVYRTRKTYPKLQNPRRPKSYLPYKVYDPKYAPAFDHKIYENAPEQNVTKPPSKAAFKLKYKPLKKEHHHKDTRYSSDNEESYEDNGFANIPGEAGKDFPILKEIPYTRFSCENRAPGFYADVENRCQVYYQCSDKGRVQSFLCPNGTVFNQATFVCEWWHNVDCAKSEKHFSKNEELYKSKPMMSAEHVIPDKYHRPSGQVYALDDYPDNYRGDGNERISKYEKPLRKRRKSHSRVTYSSSA